MGTGGVVLAGLFLTLLLPKAAHAVVASLVQVVNTRSTPVPNQDVDHPGRHAFQASCSVTSSFNNIFCDPQPQPPTGTEFVIQNISMLLPNLPNGVAPQYSQLYSVVGGFSAASFFPFTQQGANTFVLNQAFNSYSDPGPSNPIQCYVLLTGPANGSQLTCIVTGYTVSVP